MKEATFSILNSQKYLAMRNHYIDRISNIFSGKASRNEVFLLNGVYGTSSYDPYMEPELWMSESLDYLAAEVSKLADPTVFRPLCIEFGPYGVHFIDKIFGCEVFYNESSQQWYNKYLDTPIGQLELPDIDKDETWILAKRIAKAFLASNTSLPFFGLPTIASPLNVAVNLYGENILLEMCVDPEMAKHDLNIINQVLCSMHKWYIDNIPAHQLQPVVSGHRTQPPGFGQICGCTTQLLSDSMYKDIIAPFDDKLLSIYPNGGMIHLCGSHTQHIPVWREMNSLRSLQLNDRAAADLEQYYNELRDDQIIYLNPCEEMTSKRAMEITKGYRMVLVTDNTDFTDIISNY